MTALPRVGEAEDNAKPLPDDARLWSVTSIIGCLDKPALVPWAAMMTAQAAVDDLPKWKSRLDHEGRDSAIDYLKQARFRRSRGQRSATDLGTAVHAACEEYALTGTRPEVDAEVAPFMVSFDTFLQTFQPEYIASEVTVYTPTYLNAGTCDGFFKIEGVPLVFDIKTSRDSFDGQGKPKTPYPEVALQLAAYRWAECAAVWRARRFESFKRRYYLLSEDEQAMAVPVPPVDGGVVLLLTPAQATVTPINCDRDVHDAFLYVQEAARWHYELSKDVIGHPMMPPAPRPVEA